MEPTSDDLIEAKEVSGFPQGLEIMENHENHEKKFHAWKNHRIWKKLNNHGKIMEFCEKNQNLKPPIARKLAVRHTIASFLSTGGFKFWLFQNACMVYKHAYLNTLLLLHFAFKLRALKK